MKKSTANILRRIMNVCPTFAILFCALSFVFYFGAPPENITAYTLKAALVLL